MRVAVACTIPLLMLAGLWIWAAGMGLPFVAATGALTLWMLVCIAQTVVARSWQNVDTLRSVADGVLATAGCPLAGWALLLSQPHAPTLGWGGLVWGLIAALLGTGLAIAAAAWGPTEATERWLRPRHPALSDTAVAARLAHALTEAGADPTTVTIFAQNSTGHVSFGQPRPWSDAQDQALGRVAQDLMLLARWHSFPSRWSLGRTLTLPRLTAHQRLQMKAQNHA